MDLPGDGWRGRTVGVWNFEQRKMGLLGCQANVQVQSIKFLVVKTERSIRPRLFDDVREDKASCGKLRSSDSWGIVLGGVVIFARGAR